MCQSRTKAYQAAYWQQYRDTLHPRVAKACLKCNLQFHPKGRQTVCHNCSVQVCPVCASDIPRKGGRDRQFCSRSCASRQPHVVARINANRGTKPRTYLKRQRSKHGCAEDREWRMAVFARDKFTCQECGQVGGRLQADHIKSFAAYPELRHVIDNGRTLCVLCHRRTPNFGAKARKEIAAKRMSQEVLNFTPQRA